MIEFRVDKIKTDYNRRYGRPLANALGDADCCCSWLLVQLYFG